MKYKLMLCILTFRKAENVLTETKELASEASLGFDFLRSIKPEKTKNRVVMKHVAGIAESKPFGRLILRKFYRI